MTPEERFSITRETVEEALGKGRSDPADRGSRALLMAFFIRGTILPEELDAAKEIWGDFCNDEEKARFLTIKQEMLPQEAKMRNIIRKNQERLDENSGDKSR